MRKILRGMMILFVGISAIWMQISTQSIAANQDKDVVRIGYYPVADYQEVNEDGSYSGFSYDYYVQIQKYTRWNYEFVEASYAECMKMLADGEIDIMSGVTDTPDREEQFLLSDYSNSNSQNKLYASAQNQNLFYESYDAFDGCRIAVMLGMRTDELEEYGSDHDFQMEIVYYTDYEEMVDALATGTVDMVYTSSLPTTADTKIVARMKKQPLYYAVTKSKPEIAQDLNDAMQKIVDNNPEFYTQMSEKYKISGANAAATFTKEELEYIQSEKEIYLIVNSDWAPICWYDEKTESYRGIFLDVAEEIEKYSGITITICTGEEFDAMVQENPDIMGDALAVTADDTSWANEHQIMMTNHVVNSSIVMISQIGKHVDLTDPNTVIALPEEYYVSSVMQKQLQNNNIVYYQSTEECLDALNNGKADVTYANSLVASYDLSMLKYTNLYTASASGYQEALAFGVYTESDTPLLSILDKSLLCIGSEEINRIVVNYTYADESFSLEAWYYSNPELAIGLILLLCILIFLIGYFRVKAVNAMKQVAQEKMLARFMGYVCASNEDVLEVNLKEHTAQSYELAEDGTVQIHTIPYQKINDHNERKTVYPEDYEKLVKNLNKENLDQMLEQNGRERYFECRARAKDGEYQWFAYSMQAIPIDREHPRNFILFKKNIDVVKKEEEAQRRALEDALETARDASEAKGNFLSRISHEIRTPLNAIIGYLMIARREDSDTEKVDHCLKSSEAASRHLLAILNDVLDMSSIESGKLKIAREEIDLEDMVESLKEMFREQTEKKGIHFKVNVERMEQKWVMGDLLRVKQILINLLSNAVKFTSENGEVRLQITQMSLANGKCRMKFEVSDSGIGMSEKYMNRLFKPFEQESAQTAQKFGGTGLGLSISWNLVTMMGGSINVKSEQGVGTTFTVLLSFDAVEQKTDNGKRKSSDVEQTTIRVLLVDDRKEECDQIMGQLKQLGAKCDIVANTEKAMHRIDSRYGTDYAYNLCLLGEIDQDDFELQLQKQETGEVRIMKRTDVQSNLPDLMEKIRHDLNVDEEQDEEQISLIGTQILLAEDNEMNLEIAVDVLARAGLKVDTAADGKEAYDLFMQSEPGNYAAILMDVQMPVMDGYEATRAIRDSKHPQAKEIPIIAVSANAFSEDVAAALACGMNGHISKPIDFHKLYQVLAKLLQESR